MAELLFKQTKWIFKQVGKILIQEIRVNVMKKSISVKRTESRADRLQIMEETAVKGSVPVALREFELTWVVYDAADPLGPVLALFTLSPVCVVGRRCDFHKS